MSAHELAPRLPVDRPPAVASVGRPRRRPHGHLHGRPGLLHRQRRHARDAERSARRHRRHRMGHRRLRPDLRHLPHHRRAAGRPARPPAHVLPRPGPLHAGVGGLRPGAEPRRARRRAPRPGAGGRAAQPAGAVDHRRRLHRAPTASARSASTASSSGWPRSAGSSSAASSCRPTSPAWAGAAASSSTCPSASSPWPSPRARCPSRASRAASRLDLVGTALITLGLVDIVLPLVEGRQHGWPAWTWLCLGAAPITLGLFAAHQRRLSRRGGAPLLDPALFRERAFSAGLVTQLVFFSSMASYFLVLALYLQQGRGLDALQAGLVFTILAAAYLVASAYAPGLTPRLGRRLPAIGGLVLAAGHGAAGAERGRHRRRRLGRPARARGCCSRARAWASSSRP